MKTQLSEIIKEVIKPRLNQLGFKGTNNTFRKIEKDFVLVFDIWKSSWNTSSNIVFWFEIGIYGDSFYKFMFNQDRPKSIRTNHCTLRLSGDKLSKKQYQLTEINSSTIIQEIENDLYKHFLPLLSQLKTMKDLLLLEQIDPVHCDKAKLFVGFGLAELGDKQKSVQMIDEYLNAARYPEIWVERIISECNRLNLSLRPASS